MTDLKQFNFAIAHVGINCENQEEAYEVASKICALFDFELIDDTPSYFTGSATEVMKKPGHGLKGHVAIGTDDIYGAMDALKERGVEFDENATRYLEDGSLKLIYIKGDIGGFAFHLVQR